MAAIAKSCNLMQAFNFKKDRQDTIGHLVSLIIGSKKFDTDMKLISPIMREEEHVVGAMRSINWGGGKAQSIQIVASISTKNKQKFAELIHADLDSIEVQMQFVVYDYDPLKKTYYKSFHVDDNLHGIIAKSGESLQLTLDDLPNNEIQSPENYIVTLAIVPQPKEQAIAMALSQTAKMAKQWGIETA